MQYYQNLHTHNLFDWFPYITPLAPYLYRTKLIGRIRKMLQTFSLAVWIHPCHHPLPLSSVPSLCTQYTHNKIMCTHKKSVPEENHDLAGRNFCANFAFLCKITICRKFCLDAQFLRKFVTLRSAIFREVRKFCNLRAICAKIFTFSH